MAYLQTGRFAHQIMIQKIVLNLKTVSRLEISTPKALTKNWTFFAALEKLLKKLVISVDLMIFNVVLYQPFMVIEACWTQETFHTFFYFSTIMTTRREIEISTRIQIENPPFSTSGRFYRIYSPEKIVLRPWVIKTINLYFKIKLPDGIQGIITLLPIFIE